MALKLLGQVGRLPTSIKYRSVLEGGQFQGEVEKFCLEGSQGKIAMTNKRGCCFYAKNYVGHFYSNAKNFERFDSIR